MKMYPKDLHALQLSYMKQLDDADEEYAELTGQPHNPLERRPAVLGLDKPVLRGDYPSLDAYIVSLRSRANKEVVSTDSRTCFSSASPSRSPRSMSRATNWRARKSAMPWGEVGPPSCRTGLRLSGSLGLCVPHFEMLLNLPCVLNQAEW